MGAQHALGACGGIPECRRCRSAHHRASPVRERRVGAAPSADRTRTHAIARGLLFISGESTTDSRRIACLLWDVMTMKPLPETPTDAIGDIVRERVIVGGREFLIEKPSASNDLLDHPAIHSAFASDEY